MFAWHKRRQQDEEPLVPHGLVGQATENPGPPEEPKTESRPGQVHFPERPPQAKDPSEERHSKKPPRSLPLPTPTNGTAGLSGIARPHPVLAVENAKPTVEKAVVSRRQPRGNEYTAWRRWALTTIKGATRGARRLLSKTGNRISAHAHRGRILFAQVGKSALNRLPGYHLSLEWKRSFAQGHKILSELGHGAATQCRKTWEDSALRFRSLTMPVFQPKVKENQEFSLTHEEEVRVPYRVRVRLTGLPLRGKIMLTRVVSEWKLKRESLLYNSRLWTSMAMGFFVAILVLGLVYATRHYAQAGLPSNRISTESSDTTSSVPAPVSVAAHPPKLKAVAVEESTITPAVQREPLPAATVAHPQPAHPKAAHPMPHRRESEDDDYVAQDTYTYYGTSPSKSHR
jgi:hypothetical protein